MRGLGELIRLPAFWLSIFCQLTARGYVAKTGEGVLLQPFLPVQPRVGFHLEKNVNR